MEMEFKSNGHKKNHLLQILVDLKQMERLRALASASGFKSVSSYVRYQCLNPSLEANVNKILALLLKNESKKAKKAGDKDGFET